MQKVIAKLINIKVKNVTFFVPLFSKLGRLLQNYSEIAFPQNRRAFLAITLDRLEISSHNFAIS
jgi:hypothetical protein